MKKRRWCFEIVVLLVALLAIPQSNASKHGKDEVDDEIISNTLLSSIALNSTLHTKTFDSIFESLNVSRTNIDLLDHINPSLVEVLKNVSMLELLSCIPGMSIDKTIKENLQILIKSYQHSPELLNKKLRYLQSQGLKSILNKYSINLTMSKNNTLKFCHILEDLVTSHYNDTILPKEASSVNKSIADFLDGFGKLQITPDDVKKFLIALYSGNTFGMSIRAPLLTKFKTQLNKIKTNNLTLSQLNTSVSKYINSEYGIDSIFLGRILRNYFGLPGKVFDIIELVSIENITSSDIALGDLIQMINVGGQRLEKAFEQLPMIVTALNVQISGIDEIMKTKPLDILLKFAGLNELLLAKWLNLSSHDMMILNTSMTDLLKLNFEEDINTSRLMLLSLKDMVDNVGKYSGRKEKLLTKSKTGIRYILNNINTTQLQFMYAIPEKSLKTSTLKWIISNFAARNDATILKEIMDFKAATRNFFGKFTMNQLEHKTQLLGGTLKKYSDVIEEKYGGAVKEAVLKMQTFDVLPLFCHIPSKDFMRMKVGQVTNDCGGLNLDDFSSPALMKISDHTFESLKNRSMEYFKKHPKFDQFQKSLNLRRLASLSQNPEFGIALMQIKDLLTDTNYTDMKNVTMKNLLETRGKYNISVINRLLEQTYQVSLLQNDTLGTIAERLNVTYMSIFEMPLDKIVQLVLFSDDRNFVAFMDVDLVEMKCKNVTSKTIEEVGMQCDINPSNPFDSIIDSDTMLNYTLSELRQLAAISVVRFPGKYYPTYGKSLFASIVEGKAGLMRMQSQLFIPLISLSKQMGISLSGLKHNPLTKTVMKIFNIDSSILRKVFNVVPDNFYSIVQQTNFSMIPTLEDGLDNVQQLYTGSLSTIVQALISGKTSEFSVNQHLPRYVKMIAKNKLRELFQLYEISKAQFLDPNMFADMYAISRDFFGIHTDSLFQASFDIPNIKSAERLRNRSIGDILDISKYTMDPLDDELDEYSLTELVQFMTNSSRSLSDETLAFLLNPIKDFPWTELNATKLSEVLKSGNLSINTKTTKSLLNYKLKNSVMEYIHPDSLVNYLLNSDFEMILTDMNSTLEEIGSIDMLIKKAIKLGTELMELITKTPMITVAARSHIYGVDRIIKYKPLDIIIKSMKVSEGYLKMWFPLTSDQLSTLNESLLHIFEETFSKNISAQRFVLLTIKGMIDNLNNTNPGKDLITLSRVGIESIKEKVNLSSLQLMYNIHNSTLNLLPLSQIIRDIISKDDQGLYKEMLADAKPATRRFFNSFTIRQIAVKVELKDGTLQQYNNIIDSRFGMKVMEAVLKMQTFDVLPLFCHLPSETFLSMKVGQVIHYCGGMNISTMDDLSTPALMKITNHTFDSLKNRLMKYIKQHPKFDKFQKSLNLRQLASLSQNPNFGIALMQIKDLLTDTNYTDMKNVTMENLLETRGKYNISVINRLLEQTYQVSLLQNDTLGTIAERLNVTYMSIFEMPLDKIVQLVLFSDDRSFVAFMDIDLVAMKCKNVTSMNIEEIGMQCVDRFDPFAVMVNTGTTFNYTLDELKQLAAISTNQVPSKSYPVYGNSLFASIVEGNAGLMRMQRQLFIPLIFLSKQMGISLSELKHNPLTKTVMKIFNIDSSILRKVFNVVPDNFYSIVQQTNFSMIPTLEDGLDNVQQLYTGSLNTIVLALISGKTSEFSVNQHLPRYVKVIAKNKLRELFQLYEISKAQFLDPNMFADMYAISRDFFGIHTDSLFQASFDIPNIKNAERLRNRSIVDILDISKYTMDPLDDELDEYSLTKLVQFMTNSSKSLSDETLAFLFTPINDLPWTELNATKLSDILSAEKFGAVDIMKAMNMLQNYVQNWKIKHTRAENITGFVFQANYIDIKKRLNKSDAELGNVNNLIRESSKYLSYIGFFETQLKDLNISPEVFNNASLNTILNEEVQTTQLPNSFDGFKDSPVFKSAFNMTLDNLRNSLKWDVSTINTKNLFQIFDEFVTTFASVSTMKTSLIKKILLDKKIPLTNITKDSFSQLMEKTLGFNLQQLSSLPMYPLKKPFVDKLSVVKISKLNGKVIENKEPFNVELPTWLHFKYPDVLNFFMGSRELKTMKEEALKMFSVLPFGFLSNQLEITKNTLLKSSAVMVISQITGFSENELLLNKNQMVQNVLKKPTLEDLSNIYSRDFTGDAVLLMSWKSLEMFASTKKMIRIFSSTLTDNGVDMTFNRSFGDIVGNLMSVNIIMVIDEMKRIFNNSAHGKATETESSIFEHILTNKTFSEYLISMRKSKSEYSNVTLVKIVQKIYQDLSVCDRDAEYCTKLDVGSMCSNADEMFGKTCVCKKGYLFNGTQCLNINECETNSLLCHDNATCTDTMGSHVCECKEGFSGDGRQCANACNETNCPAESDCVNVDTGALCVCKNMGSLYNKNENVCEEGKAVIQLTNMKFDLKYNEEYKNKLSKKYTEISRMIGNSMLTFLQRENSDVIGVNVLEIRKGSIVVDVDIVLKAILTKDEKEQLKQHVNVNAMKAKELQELKPSANFSASLADANLCNDGNNPCITNEYCEVTSLTTYNCKCVDDYVFNTNNGKCEEDETSSVAVKVVVPIVVITIVIVFVAFLLYARRKNNRKTKYSSHITTSVGKSNPTYEMDE